jgi:hypothetical protein
VGSVVLGRWVGVEAWPGRYLTKGALWMRPDTALTDWRRCAARASRRKGQQVELGYASGSMRVRRGLRREGTRGGSRSAWRGGNELAPAKCLMKHCQPEHGR